MEDIVIIGGGIIGCCTAYFLTRHPKYDQCKHRVTVLDGCGPATAASGKAGGFLALDWHRNTTSSLAELSFRLHETLADEHSGDKLWGYRKLNTLSVEFDCRDSTKKAKKKAEVNAVPIFLDARHASRVEELGSEKTTAQVHPQLFSRTLLKLAEERGAKFIKSFATLENNAVCFVDPSSTDSGKTSIAAKHIVVAAGPWTQTLLPSIDVSGCRAHSITIATPPNAPLSAHAIFSSITLKNGVKCGPEIYPRLDEVYVCGEGDGAPLPARADMIEPESSCCLALKSAVDEVSPVLKDLPIKAQQACFLPTGGPFIGKGPNGVWVAAGHGCWGICLGPGTGKVMSELLLDGHAKSADIKKLAPPS